VILSQDVRRNPPASTSHGQGEVNDKSATYRTYLKPGWTTNQSFLKVFFPHCSHVVSVLAPASPSIG
jgi:hypothetical protein